MLPDLSGLKRSIDANTNVQLELLTLVRELNKGIVELTKSVTANTAAKQLMRNPITGELR